MNKKTIIGLILILGIFCFAFSPESQRFYFGEATLLDTNGSVKIEDGGLYVEGNIHGTDYYIGADDKIVLTSTPGIGDFSLENEWNVATPETQFLITRSDGIYRWYINAVEQMTLDIANGLRVHDNLVADSIFATKSYTITLDADDKEADTKTSYLRIDSDDALSTERTFTLSDGVYDGQELFISFIAETNQAEIIDAGSEAGLNGNFTFDNQYESLTMKWDATLSIWMEQCRVDN